MPLLRRVPAAFVAAEAHERAPATPEDVPGQGLWLSFDPAPRYAEVGRVRDPVDLGPELTLGSAAGIAKLVRLFRALRLTAGADPEAWLGRAQEAADRLGTGIGTTVALLGRTRSRLQFTAWTDEGVETIRDVADVTPTDDAYLVRQLGHGLPIRVPRESIARQETTRERWFEVHSIERP